MPSQRAFLGSGDRQAARQLLGEDDSLVGISTAGDVEFDRDSKPGRIAIAVTESGQRTTPLDELAETFGWKNNLKVMKLPTWN